MRNPRSTRPVAPVMPPGSVGDGGATRHERCLEVLGAADSSSDRPDLSRPGPPALRARPPLGRSRHDAELRELLRERREVGPAVGLGRDPPDCPEITTRGARIPEHREPPEVPFGMLRAGGAIVGRVRQMMPESSERALLEGLADRVGVVEVAPRLRQEEDGVVGPGRPIPDRLRHRIRLRPDAIGPEPPAPALELEGDSPGNPDQVLRLEPGRPLVHPTGLLGPRAIPAGEGRALPSLLAR